MKLQVGAEGDLEIKAYYAGHVLGAAMFLVRVRDQSIVYTVSPGTVTKHMYDIVVSTNFAQYNEALMKGLGHNSFFVSFFLLLLRETTI
jgi:hypothetical protein